VRAKVDLLVTKTRVAVGRPLALAEMTSQAGFKKKLGVNLTSIITISIDG
jgi:hypothetical protein